MNNNSNNPLDLFEVVNLTGRFIELWQVSPHGQYEFDPTELLSHSRVSKTWQAALLPILWEVYDGDRMDWIPSQTITKFSHLFRIMINCNHSGPFHCKTLQRFETSCRNHHSMCFIQSTQPQILSLCWRGESQPLDLSEESNQNTTVPASMKLSSIPTTIDCLELQRWWIQDLFPFLQFLRRYESLSVLSLNVICNFHIFRPSTSIDGLLYDIVLPCVKALVLDFTAQRNNGRHDMGPLELLKYCPSLERLETIGLWTQYARSYETTPFHHYCPLLNSLHMKLAYWDSDKLPVFVDDSDLASLIKLTEVPSRILKQDYPQAVEIINGEEIEVQGEGGGLRTIAAELLTFHGCVSEALVSAHADSLQVLELDLRSTYDADKIDMLYAVQNVLFNCCNLQRFSFKHMHNEDKDDDQVHILFIEPWACSETLEELHILNIGSQSSTDRVLEDFEVDIGDGSDNTWIWHAEGKMKLTEEIELQITVQIMLMPRLKRLSLNRVQFSRTKRHYIS